MALNVEQILASARTRTPVVMGIVNVTPDSFSDGGEHFRPADAVAWGERLLCEGADVLDVGAESTRPGSRPVPPAEQIARLAEVVGPLCRLGAPVSVDTTSSEVARYALDRGASMVNDVSAGRDDPALLAVAAERGAAVCLMHMLGEPRTMQADPRYRDVVAEVRTFLADRLAAAEAAGVPAGRCILDPGIGFGKRLEHNLALLGGVASLLELGRPVLIGVSRKRSIGDLTGRDAPADRVAGSVAAALAAWSRGATIFRVHDVAAHVDALAVTQAVEKGHRPDGRCANPDAMKKGRS